LVSLGRSVLDGFCNTDPALLVAPGSRPDSVGGVEPTTPPIPI
jgi:hypothetical protein